MTIKRRVGNSLQGEGWAIGCLQILVQRVGLELCVWHMTWGTTRHVIRGVQHERCSMRGKVIIGNRSMWCRICVVYMKGTQKVNVGKIREREEYM